MKEQINTLLMAIGLKAVEVKLEQMMLNDGQTVVEAEVFEANQSIVIVTEDEQKIALPVGEYTLEDGRMIVIAEEGIIAEVKEVEEEVTEETPEAEAEPVAQAEKPTAQPVAKRVVESVSKESYFSKDEMMAEVEKLVEAKLLELKAVEPAVEEVIEMAKPLRHNPEPKTTQLKCAGKESLIEFLNNK